MYEFHNFLRPILLLMYSFWIPQIVTNVIRDSRKPLHPHYILGMTVTRLAVPLYIFGCPNNFMRIEPDKSWCICLSVFLVLQASILLLQHYLGSRCFIPRQVGSILVFLSFLRFMVTNGIGQCYVKFSKQLCSVDNACAILITLGIAVNIVMDMIFLFI